MNYEPGMSIGAFEITAVDELSEYKSKGIRLTHKATGMDVYHIHNNDSENMFAYVFKTPPSDDTGMPHIIEHAVLAGSESYPVKDPFLSLMKGSVNTFLNAMTYPDKTVYPAASPVKEDFFNLLSVYSDAVFRPLLRKEVFHQEGRRYVVDESGLLDVTGVVYNEMKGSFSSFESVVADHSFRSLFPDSTYRFESGGDPEAIRDLKYEDFLEFYKTYYHPSNCLFFMYGDVPTEETLAHIEPYLQNYSRSDTIVEIAPQPDWNEPRTFSFEGPAGNDGTEKTTFTINWRLTPLTDPLEVLSLEMVSEILLGNQGSPMYKALYESPYGEDLSPSCGIDTDLQDLVFTLGIRGAKTKDRDAFVTYVFDQLKLLISDGIPEDVINGSLNKVEFRNREIKGGIPFGLRLMGKVLRGWLHGLNPDATLGFAEYIEEIKNRYHNDPGYFEKLIQTYIIDNKHYSVIVVEPSAKYHKKKDAAHKEWRNKKTAALSDEDRDVITADEKAFEAFQAKTDSKEDIDSIPSLSLKDIPSNVRHIDNSMTALDDRPLFIHEIFTNGIVYSDVAFSIGFLNETEEMLLPFFGRVLNAVGVGDLTYDQAATKLSLISGGMFSFIEISNNIKTGHPDAFFFIRTKSVFDKNEEVLCFLSDILNKGHLEDKKRIKDLLIEYRNELRTALVSAGHSFALLRAASSLSPIVMREERWRGIEQYRFINAIADSIDTELEMIVTVFKSLKETLLTRSRVSFNLTCEKNHMEAAQAHLLGLLKSLPSGSQNIEEKKKIDSSKEIMREAFSVPSTVNYAAAVIPGALITQEEYAHESLVTHLLKTEQLWEKIRMQGGAYGAFASVNGTEGLVSFGSYRDPHIARTYKSFMESLEELSNGVSESALEKAKITLLGKEFKPLSPGETSMIGFRRDLYGIDDELRQTKHMRIYNTSSEDVAACAKELLDKMKNKGSFVVVGSEKDISKAADEMPEFKGNITQLL